jgi:hypothetical protein
MGLGAIITVFIPIVRLENGEEYETTAISFTHFKSCCASNG